MVGSLRTASTASDVDDGGYRLGFNGHGGSGSGRWTAAAILTAGGRRGYDGSGWKRPLGRPGLPRCVGFPPPWWPVRRKARALLDARTAVPARHHGRRPDLQHFSERDPLKARDIPRAMPRI